MGRLITGHLTKLRKAFSELLPPPLHRRLRAAPHPRFPEGLALPNQLTWLLKVGWEG